MATDSYRHKTATRRNNPTPETESMMTDEDRKPKPFTINRYEIATPVLTWDRQGETSALGGDDAEDLLLRMEALPLYVREKVSPAEFVNQLRKSDSGVQVSMDDFNGLPDGADPLNFYEHSGNWQNRLIHGDSADVMKSLIAKDGLAGQVQMIYYDPPYGMSYQSNFQPTTDNLDVKDNESAVPAGDALPIRAFRDTYRNGVHSYLDGIHKQCVLARELLTASGSLFVQIGDENVHPARSALGRSVRRRQPRRHHHLATNWHARQQAARRKRQLPALVRQGQGRDQVQLPLHASDASGVDGRLHLICGVGAIG